MCKAKGEGERCGCRIEVIGYRILDAAGYRTWMQLGCRTAHLRIQPTPLVWIQGWILDTASLCFVLNLAKQRIICLGFKLNIVRRITNGNARHWQ